MGGYGVTRFAEACLAAFLVVLLLRCSRCEGRKLMLAAEERGGDEVMHFEGGLELRIELEHKMVIFQMKMDPAQSVDELAGNNMPFVHCAMQSWCTHFIAKKKRKNTGVQVQG
ncbi:hypothetical protein OsI_20730 [Oryza sativa Indica Group]|uniref:Uncharacterized protein n=1 Tax=Oryza sativa subsp. indica TaxID=39946 RepID=A2Y6S7_ORYSI|nr:hypothetical protein OsI_20730 [Oryza sativa Indica Group]